MLAIYVAQEERLPARSASTRQSNRRTPQVSANTFDHKCYCALQWSAKLSRCGTVSAIEPPAQISQPVPLVSQIATRFPSSDEGRSDDLPTPAKSQEGLAAIGLRKYRRSKRKEESKAMAKAYKHLRRQRTERRLKNQSFMEPSKRPLTGKRKKSFIRSLFSKNASEPRRD